MAKKILAFCAAIMAFAVVPAVASATNSPELVEGGTRVEVGKLIQATNTGATLMTNTSGEKLVECEKAVMTGSVTKNDGSNIEGNITAASFENTGSVDCSGILGATRVTPNPATNGLPWCIRSVSTFATDEVQIRGNSCSGLARPIRFALDVTLFGSTCVYQRSGAIVGTITTGAGKTVVSINNQLFTLLEGGFGCPEEGLLTMSFKLETDGTETALDIV